MSEGPAQPRGLPGEPAPAAPTNAAWIIALLGWTTLLSFYHLHGGAGFEPTDAWVAQTSREMRETGEYIVPQFAGEPFLQKSPGPYWAVILTSYLRGTPVDDIAARFPNAVAALLMVATIFWLTRRIAGDRAAIFAGFASASSVFILYWSHRAAAELGVACCITVSLACLWIASASEPPGWKRNLLWLIGYFAAGVGMLYKMPMPLACVGLPAVLYLLIRNRWRVLASWWHLLGLVVFLLPWLPWVIAVCFAEPAALDKWRVEFLDRFTGALPNVEAHKAWWFYFLYLIPPLIFCIPYTLSLPQAIVRAFRRQAGVSRDGMIFMAIWFFGLLAFFTASSGKEIRYFLPALPPLFVLLGCELAAFFDPNRRPTPDRDRLGLLAVCILVPLAFGGGGYALYKWHVRHEFFEWSHVWPPYAMSAVIFTAGAVLSAGFYRQRRENFAFGALVGTMWLFWLWFWPNMMPILVSQKPVIDFATQLKERIPPEYRDRLRNVGFHDPRVIWLTDIRYPRVFDPLELLELQQGRRSLEFERRRIAEKMIGLLSDPKPVLLVATRPDYVTFLVEAPPELEKEGRSMPRTYLWLQTRFGPQYKHLVVLSNKKPPWPEPELEPPSKRLQEAEKRQASSRPASAQARM